MYQDIEIEFFRIRNFCALDIDCCSIFLIQRELKLLIKKISMKVHFS